MAAGRDGQPSAAILDSRTLQSTPESEVRAGDDGQKRRKGSKVHAAVDSLGHLLALVVTSADAQGRTQVAELAAAVQDATGEAVEVAFVEQRYTGARPVAAAAAGGIRLEVVKLPEVKRGGVLLPRRWVVERDARLGLALPAPRPRRRTPAPGAGRPALRGLCLPHAPLLDPCTTRPQHALEPGEWC